MRNATPARYDPTRTATLRRAACATLRKRFGGLKRKVRAWVAARVPPTVNKQYPDPHHLHGTLSWEERAALHPPSDGRILEVPDVRQPDHYSCGAAAALSVGQYHGVGPATLGAWKRLLGTDVEESTHPAAIAGAFRAFGCEVEERHGADVAWLAGCVRRGMPVICPVQDYGPWIPAAARFDYGHYLTVIGVHPQGYVFCQDSSEDNVLADSGSVQMPGRVMICTIDWLRAWHDVDAAGVPYVHHGIAVGAPGPFNTFCPTGPGGGQDNTCGKGAGARAVELLGRYSKAAVARIRDKVTEKYRQLEKRYGSKYAKAIIAAALVGVPLPLPGASFATAAPVLALAEMHRLFVRNEAVEPVEPVDIEQAARELLAELERELVVNDAGDLLREFEDWLAEQFDTEDLTDEELWQQFVERGFLKGAGRAFDDVRSRELLRGDREEFLRSSLGRPVAVEKVKLLAGRSYAEMDGVTDALAREMTRALADGLVQGDSPREIADALADRIDIGEARAEVVARTEIIRAHAEGQLDALEDLGVTEVGVEVEWLTAGDGLVCPECAALEGQTFDLDDARGMLPLHPNCRCAWVPAVPAENAFRPADPGGGGGDDGATRRVLRRRGATGIDIGVVPPGVDQDVIEDIPPGQQDEAEDDTDAEPRR